ncbi:MAG: phosphoglucomutase/phosphomannomutase family protein, partial [Proteobacteria bacterium]|nr:phosphoglucomutase/phosphomannomutase family protein [Pseudomonadota bacterium]
RAADFHGATPDPRPERIDELRQATRELVSPALGLANDGDADRLAAVDGTGRVLSETEVLALVLDHGIRSGRVRTGVAISVATGSLVERLARDQGLRVVRRPIGFARLSRALADGEADAAGEESGGFALEKVGRDKDGILAGLLLVERVAADGVPLEDALAELQARYGRCACARRALPATPERCQALARIVGSPPERLGDQAVCEVWSEDGIRLGLADGFLMLRASQTEPVLRLYAEAPEPEALSRRLAEGEALLEDR